MALYHKYRPQKFDDVVGQQHIKKTLVNAIKKGMVSHAYIFSGPRGVGKTTLARLLAKSLNCQKRLPGQYEPCNTCLSCKAISLGNSLDVIEIDAASNRGIDEIRELREKIRFAPTASNFKVYIIDEVHMLTREAFNALLKTLEEPPKHAIFIMATTEPHRVPETIISRAQEFGFKRARPEEVISYLKKVAEKEKIRCDEAALALIVRSSEGSYRDAISFFDQVSSISSNITLDSTQEILGLVPNEILAKLTAHLINREAKKAIELVNQLYQNGYDLLQLAQDLIEHLRERVVGQGDYPLLPILKRFIPVAREIKTASLPQLPFELAILEVVSAETDLPSGKKDIAVSTETKKKGKEEFAKQVITTPSQPANKAAQSDLPKRAHPSGRDHPAGQPVILEDINKKWPRFLEEIRKENHFLITIFSEAKPERVESGNLYLAVPNRFYAERLMDPRRYEIITNTLDKIFNQKLRIDCIIKEREDRDALHEVKNIFEAV